MIDSSGFTSSGGQVRQVKKTIYFSLYTLIIRIFKLVCANFTVL